MKKGILLLLALALASSTALAAGPRIKRFNCESRSGEGLFGIERIFVKISYDNERLTIYHELDGQLYIGAGERDHDYAPRKNNVVRYTGDYEDLISESGSVEVVVAKNLLEKQSRGGKLWLRWRGEAMDLGKFDCKLIVPSGRR